MTVDSQARQGPTEEPSQGCTETLRTDESITIVTSSQKKRRRCSLPPQESRDWLTAKEAALFLGCSVATVHRLRRGLFAGIPPLPSNQYGRKFVFGKASVSQWRAENETRGPR